MEIARQYRIKQTTFYQLVFLQQMSKNGIPDPFSLKIPIHCKWNLNLKKVLY
jgi:hypothetical protein